MDINHFPLQGTSLCLWPDGSSSSGVVTCPYGDITLGDEVYEHGTSPTDADTDDGGVEDGVEVERGSDPLDPADDFPDGVEPDVYSFNSALKSGMFRCKRRKLRRILFAWCWGGGKHLLGRSC